MVLPQFKNFLIVKCKLCYVCFTIKKIKQTSVSKPSTTHLSHRLQTKTLGKIQKATAWELRNKDRWTVEGSQTWSSKLHRNEFPKLFYSFSLTALPQMCTLILMLLRDEGTWNSTAETLFLGHRNQRRATFRQQKGAGNPRSDRVRKEDALILCMIPCKSQPNPCITFAPNSPQQAQASLRELD